MNHVTRAFLLVGAGAWLTVSAQALTVVMNDGTRSTYQADEVQKLTYGAQTGSLVLEVHTNEGQTVSHKLTDIRKLTFGTDDATHKAGRTRAHKGEPFFGVMPASARGVVSIAVRLERPGHVAAEVFDVHGRVVQSLHHGELEAGEHTLYWNTGGDGDRLLTGGFYLLRTSVRGRVLTSKLFLVK